MNISRRNVLLGATAAAAFAPLASRAQTSEVVIGVIYPLSGASAQIGVDAQKAFETAADLINKNYDFDLPLAKGEGLSGLGGAKIRLVFADHQADPHRDLPSTCRGLASRLAVALRCGNLILGLQEFDFKASARVRPPVADAPRLQ